MKLVQVTHEILTNGQRYEDRYGNYMKFFEQMAAEPEPCVVISPPCCWVPLLEYMGHKTRHPTMFFERDDIVYDALALAPADVRLDRTTVEVLCGFRPETVDSLWKYDRQWKHGFEPMRKYRKEFIVTSNGSFDCPEIQAYEKALAAYVPIKRKVVLVPCAADKPYPSRLHKAVLEIMPDDFYLANVTGVVGIVPMDLWDVMPHYDSGIPNEWRCMNVLRQYFTKHPHDCIISYADFYNLAIDAATQLFGQLCTFINPVQFYSDYLDLLDPARLAKLKEAFDVETGFKGPRPNPFDMGTL